MFGLLGAILVAVIELELERVIGLVRFTEYWSGRAIVQVPVCCKDPIGGLVWQLSLRTVSNTTL